MSGFKNVLRLSLLILSSPSWSQPSPSPKPYRIAALYPKLSALNPLIGQEAICITTGAIEAAQKEGLPIELEVIDNQRNALETVRAAQTVVDKKFDGVVGTLDSSEALAASPIFRKAGIPFIATMASNPGVTQDNPLAFRIQFDDNRQAKLLAKLTANELGAKKVLIVRNASLPYSDFLGTEYQKQLRLLRPEIAMREIVIIEGFSDFEKLRDQIVAEKADVNFLPLLQAQLAPIYNQLKALPGSFTLLGGDTVGGSPTFMNMLGEVSPRIKFYFVRGWDSRPVGPLADLYVRLQKAHCPHIAQSVVNGSSFDAVQAFIAAVRAKVKKSDAAPLAEIIRRNRLRGVTGPLDFSESGSPTKPLYIYQIKPQTPSFWKLYQ
ncbi:MAG TPA: ABC transporter substrate-binding protein [Bdellovibrionota bacterium]|jgi:branched-chain amino acid transport system substrate-binding protein|nr:ABC transporter substrate-binding protein [Bdellovibrionota bacterium]